MEDVAPGRSSEGAVQTLHVREVAANLLLSRSLQMSDAAGGMVVFQDADGRWNKDSFALPGRPNRIQELAPLLEALLEWTLYSEKPVAIANLENSRWSQHLLHEATPPEGAVAATPLAQRGLIWGAVAVYWAAPVKDAISLLGELAELATEPLSSLGPGRPEGIA